MRLSLTPLVIVLLAVLPGGALAQLDTAWVRRYDGPTHGGDAPRTIQLDAEGNVVVTGNSDGMVKLTYSGMVTLKYSPSGDTIWSRTYIGPDSLWTFPWDLEVDSQGNVYVVGETDFVTGFDNYDIFLVKYDGDGNVVWERFYNGPGNRADYAEGLALDVGGDIYVVGGSTGVGTSIDYVLLKYSADGALVRERRYNGPGNGEDWPIAIAVDQDGEVYVTGQSYSAVTGDDFTTIKYSASGDTLWVRRYSSPNAAPDRADKVAANSDGTVIVAGRSYNTATGFDYTTIKYDQSGEIQWVRLYNGAGNNADLVNDLEVDGVGNAYVTGESNDGNGSDYTTIKYYPDGDTAWVRRYGGNNQSGVAYALGIDTVGNVFVTGSLSGNCTTLKYAAAGGLIWSYSYDGPGHGYDDAIELETGRDGAVYVTGASVGETQTQDYATIKYVCELPATPGAPVTTNPAPCSNERYTIQWGPVGGASTYELFENGIKVAELTTTAWGLSRPSGSFSYFVRAKNVCGVSGDSPIGGSTTIQFPPGAPGPPVTSDSYPCSNESYVISWDAVPNATGYELEENGIAVYSGSETTATLSRVSGAFDYGVIARNTCGPSAVGPTGGTTVPTGVPAVPAMPATSSLLLCNESTYSVYWHPVLGATSYRLLENGSLAYEGTDTAVQMVHVFGTYSYVVTAQNKCGSSLGSEGGANTVIQYCPCHADPQCDSLNDVLDVVATVAVAFRSQPATTDPFCPRERTDVDCSGATDVLDVVAEVDVAFRSADPTTKFCDPCAP